MIELVLTYCLAADPSRCVEKRPLLDEPFPSAMACMVQAQPMAGDFIRQHPAYVLVRFRCEIDRPKEART